MNKKLSFQKLATLTDLTSESLPGLPLVEIAGNCRVFVERHQGVIAYNTEQIQIKVAFGQICVCGCNLELMQMNKTQLVITGKIQAVYF